MILNKQQIGKILRESGYRRAWLAERIGISQFSFSMYVNGHRPMPKSVMIALAYVLDIPEEKITECGHDRI